MLARDWFSAQSFHQTTYTRVVAPSPLRALGDTWDADTRSWRHWAEVVATGERIETDEIGVAL